MQFPESKALEIATQITVSKATNSNISLTGDGGQNVADFFKAVYEGVKEITSNIEH